MIETPAQGYAGQTANEGTATDATEGGGGGQGAATSFRSGGALPPVSKAYAAGTPPSPSERAFGHIGGGNAGDLLAFNSGEHQRYGDDAAGNAGRHAPYKEETKEEQAGKKDPEQFALTHGDINMLSGDYFEPREVDAKGNHIADNLYELMGKPSTSPGKQRHTRDELIAAIKDAVPNDPRFAAGGVWHDIVISDEVTKAVHDRYLDRASHNYEHFAQPTGPKSGGSTSGDGTSAGGSYHALHENAIKMAAAAKRDGRPIDDALAHDAGAEHFLEDNFAAGHLRTPRQSIETFWHAKYPLFFENFKKTIAKDVALSISAHDSGVATDFTLNIQEQVLDQVDAATATLPPVGIETIVAELAHDEDNADGLAVVNDLGQKWKTFGDSHGGLDPKHPEQAETQKHVEEAVRLSIEDVQHAYDAGPGATDQETFSKVRSATSAPAKANGAKYGAEQLVPRPDPAAKGKNGTQGWEQPDFEKLWKAKIRSDKPDTFKSEIEKSAKTGDIHDQLSGLGALFPEVQEVTAVGHNFGTLHPRAAFQTGFLDPMTNNPHDKLLQVINYNPGRGLTRTGTAAEDDMDRMEKHGTDAQAAGVPGADKDMELKGMTVASRAEYVENLESVGGWSTNSGDEAKIIDLFRTATPKDRHALYRRLEGHDWDGQFHTGTWFGDHLEHDMSDASLKTLKTLLDQKK